MFMNRLSLLGLIHMKNMIPHDKLKINKTRNINKQYLLDTPAHEETKM